MLVQVQRLLDRAKRLLLHLARRLRTVAILEVFSLHSLFYAFVSHCIHTAKLYREGTGVAYKSQTLTCRTPFLTLLL